MTFSLRTMHEIQRRSSTAMYACLHASGKHVPARCEQNIIQTR